MMRRCLLLGIAILMGMAILQAIFAAEARAESSGVGQSHSGEAIQGRDSNPIGLQQQPTIAAPPSATPTPSAAEILAEANSRHAILILGAILPVMIVIGAVIWRARRNS